MYSCSLKIHYSLSCSSAMIAVQYIICYIKLYMFFIIYVLNYISSSLTNLDVKVYYTSIVGVSSSCFLWCYTSYFLSLFCLCIKKYWVRIVSSVIMFTLYNMVLHIMLPIKFLVQAMCCQSFEFLSSKNFSLNLSFNVLVGIFLYSAVV